MAARGPHDEQTGRKQRRSSGQPRSAGAGGLGQPAQPQGHSDGRAPPRDVVVQVAVELLEPAVEVGCQRGQQQLHVQVDQLGAARQGP
jgi:hypothetical protein